MALDKNRFGRNRLYHDLAHLWPVISPPEEYAEEAALCYHLLREKLGSGAHPILELGVGGGHNLSHFSGKLQVTAVDLSERMLAHSRRLNPEVEHLVGDMRSVRLGRTFKAVLIHDAISYMTTEPDLRATLETAALHLEPGGVIVVAPDWLRETFSGPKVFHSVHLTDDGLEVTHIEYIHDPDPRDTSMETIMLFMLRRRGEGGALTIEEDLHVTGLFPGETWTQLLRATGFEAERRSAPPWEDGSGGYLFVGVLG